MQNPRGWRREGFEKLSVVAGSRGLFAPPHYQQLHLFARFPQQPLRETEACFLVQTPPEPEPAPS
jgi:hypothetical protein